MLAIGEEYSAGMIRITFIAIPRRLVVLAAKTVTVAGCLIAGRQLLPGGGLGPAHGYPLIDMTDTATVRAAVGTVLHLILVALVTLGIATAIRDTAVSIGTILGLLYLLLQLIQAVSGSLQRRLERIAPMPAGMAIQATSHLHQAIGPWGGLGVLTCWAAGALLLGGLTLRLRDT